MVVPAPQSRVRTRTQAPRSCAYPERIASSKNVATRAAQLQTWSIDRFRLPVRALRKPGKTQMEKLEAAVGRFGFNVPVLCTSDGEIIDGAKRFRAAQALGYETLPVAVVDGLSAHEVEALRISVSKLAELSVWDTVALAEAFKNVLEVDPELTRFTGFETAELDALLFANLSAEPNGEEACDAPDAPVSRVGDIFNIGPHRLMCGDAMDPSSYERLLKSQPVQMVLGDVPYGVKISGVCSRSHGEFVEGSDCDDAEMRVFFEEFLTAANGVLLPGCVIDLFIDFRSMCALALATRSVNLEHLATCVWDKQTGGLGGTYRNQEGLSCDD